MQPCDDDYKRWEALNVKLEKLEDACSESQKLWVEDFRSALDNLARPDLCIDHLIKSQQGFDVCLQCRQKYDDFLNAEWWEAMADLWDCVQQYGHHDPA